MTYPCSWRVGSIRASSRVRSSSLLAGLGSHVRDHRQQLGAVVGRRRHRLSSWVLGVLISSITTDAASDRSGRGRPAPGSAGPAHRWSSRASTDRFRSWPSRGPSSRRAFAARSRPGWPRLPSRGWPSWTTTSARIATGAGPSDDATDAERRRWFYTPTDHGGLTVHQQRPAQQRAAMRLVVDRAVDRPAYVTVATIMGLENVLDQVEGFVARSSTASAGATRGSTTCGCSAIRAAPAPWGWRFGGHHVSLNNLVVDGELVVDDAVLHGRRPGRLTASGRRGEPAARPGRGPGPRAGPVAGARRLRQRAVLLPKAPSDFVTANRTADRRRGPGDPAGRASGATSGSPTTAEQAKLQALSDADRRRRRDYTDDDHERVAYTAAPKGRARRASSTPASATCCGRCSAPTSAACPDGVSPMAVRTTTPRWTPCTSPGPARLEPGAPHYYRLQGPRLLIEWDNTQRGANHAHSVWRDPSTDFGLDVLARHRADNHG